jgi:RHS repeat-associated protein
MFVYGNYIDEVLLMYTGAYIYYAHDHLYSPAALIFSGGVVLERYEYDAYGDCHVLEPNYADDPDGKSDYGNPYLFTGRRVDILDEGSLKIQYNRNRYYDYYTGRWTTHDPLGINPAGGKENPFSVLAQYAQGLALYEYVKSDPVGLLDEYGLCCGICWEDDSGITRILPVIDPTDPFPPSVPLPPAKDCEWRRVGFPWFQELSEWADLLISFSLPAVTRGTVGRRGELPPVTIGFKIWPEWKKPDPRKGTIRPGFPCRCRWLEIWDTEYWCCRDGMWSFTGERGSVETGEFETRGTVELSGISAVPFRCSCWRDFGLPPPASMESAPALRAF